MSEKRYALGLDFGTESARALLVAVDDGHVAATAVSAYRHGVMDSALPDGTPLGHEWALQDPDDYLDSLTETAKKVLAEAGVSAEQVVGIGVDFTACTILPVDEDNTPLCKLERFAATPHAWVKLWKHHAAQRQADRFNEVAERRGEPWLKVYGYSVSCEWLIPKTMQVLDEAPEGVRRRAPHHRGGRLGDSAAHGRRRAEFLQRRIQGVLRQGRGVPQP